MTSAEKLNLFLLIVNSNFTIATFLFLCFLMNYLFIQAKNRTKPWSVWLVNLPVGVFVAGALYIEGFGNLMTRAAVWAWRFEGGDDPFSLGQMSGIVAGSIIGLLGLVLMLIGFSYPRYGHWPWIAACAVLLSNTIINLAIFLLS